MKQSRSEQSDKQGIRYSAAKAAIALCAAVVVIAGCTFAVYGSSAIGTNEAVKAADIAFKAESVTVTGDVSEEVPEAAEEPEVTEAFTLVDMKKAEVGAYAEGYSSAEADKATSTTTTTSAAATTTAPETTTAPKTTTSKATTTRKSVTEEAEKIEMEQPAEKLEEVKFNQFSAAKTMYVVSSVNFRKGPSMNDTIMEVLDRNKEVKVTALSADGQWYAAQADGLTGYIMAKYLSENKITTTTTTTAARQPDISGTGSVISYNAVDFEMMTYVVQSEVGNCDEKSKLAVCNVMINRVKSNEFPNTLAEVLTQKGQFTAVSHYYNKTNPPNQNTIDCCLRALNGEGAWIVNGATFYYTPKYSSAKAAAWFESLCLCASFDGQRFFKNW
ncbi:MAG: cell wall hydrolase [Ruminococcus sp.]|nr:cell wall hydrolase [Ruminococcus sp.]